jgi:hypothetical protein
MYKVLVKSFKRFPYIEGACSFYLKETCGGMHSPTSIRLSIGFPNCYSQSGVCIGFSRKYIFRKTTPPTFGLYTLVEI